jgi:hypothetical protein
VPDWLTPPRSRPPEASIISRVHKQSASFAVHGHVLEKHFRTPTRWRCCAASMQRQGRLTATKGAPKQTQPNLLPCLLSRRRVNIFIQQYPYAPASSLVTMYGTMEQPKSAKNVVGDLAYSTATSTNKRKSFCNVGRPSSCPRRWPCPGGQKP